MNRELTLKTIGFFLISSLLLTSCDEENYTPKPKGYFRIDLPEKNYHKIEKDCPFIFEVPDYANIEQDPRNPNNKCWFNINFTSLNASIYLSYKPVNNDLNIFLEDSRTLAFKHTVKAIDIQQKTINNPDKNMFGLIYDIKGDAASEYQFHLTDSTNHFLRGSLYFNNAPNQDSIQPVLNFIKQDIEHLFETFEWKN
ncbi:gliding motility lipoprotein GldD [Vicingus serpentipes]|uniref:Gliding motility lipoprotein GldD n=1 Tax=Vicingus serpentipes TaxID=1926625 RepID=A0A5C6RV72_9FLAO|nr:gliding motility lipoprotein GldD [Vicingus serpentipes]TXB65789.1 gliding motility lipoprotein GldD [Vicingus serpentipes]